MQDRQVKKMDLNKKDLILGIILLVAFGVLIIMSSQITITKQSTGVITGKSVPLFVSVLGVIFSILLILRSAIKMQKEKKSGEQKDEYVPAKRWGMLAISVGLVLVYILLINVLGFPISSALFLFVQILILSDKKTVGRIILIAAIAILLSALLYVAFRYGLSVMLPMGIFR